MTPSAEYQLLLDAVIPRSQHRADLGAWGSREWGQALRVAEWHRLSPLLYTHLESRAGVPPVVHSALERSYLASAARSMLIRATLHRIRDALAGEGIAVIPLKGAALIETIYADPAEREMLDIDLLVRPSQLGAATETLGRLGYRPAPADGDDDPAAAGLTFEPHHDAPLVEEHQLVAIELHRHITIEHEGSRFDIEAFWDRATQAVPGASIALSPEDMLLHLCLHFTRNRLGGSYRWRNSGGALAQVGDIVRMVQSRPPDWTALQAAADGYGLRTRVFLGLFAAHALGAQIPAEGLALLRPEGFDDRVGRRLVALRVLRSGEDLPPRTLRWMLAPSREVLSSGWSGDPAATASLARAYLRRAWAHAPEAKVTLRRPMQFLQNRRLNDQIQALEEHV